MYKREGQTHKCTASSDDVIWSVWQADWTEMPATVGGTGVGSAPVNTVT